MTSLIVVCVQIYLQLMRLNMLYYTQRLDANVDIDIVIAVVNVGMLFSRLRVATNQALKL